MAVCEVHADGARLTASAQAPEAHAFWTMFAQHCTATAPRMKNPLVRELGTARSVASKGAYVQPSKRGV